MKTPIDNYYIDSLLIALDDGRTEDAIRIAYEFKAKAIASIGEDAYWKSVEFADEEQADWSGGHYGGD